jgi:formamidopyrimidine-DNA glycosylase
MPELPDLQVFSHNLTKLFAGKTLKKVTIVNDRKLKIPAKTLKKSLENQALKKIYREGKELRFEFSNGNILGMHLMLKGQLYLFEKKNDHNKTIIELLFADGKGLAMADYQGMATPVLNPESTDAPDALSKKMDFAFLKQKLSTTRTTIKNLLLDQHVVRGIGNAYADEILWDAGISPFSICNRIPDDKIRQLVKSIRKILIWAEKQIKKIEPGIISGETRDFLPIHNSQKTKSPTGSKILKKAVGGRKTYYTREQKLFK